MVMECNLGLLPPVKRARGYRLYTESRRFVDLYLDGGRAVLGHNAANVLRELKNAAERSLFAPYPSYYVRRFEKALALLFPGKSLAVMEAVPAAVREAVPVRRPYMGGGAEKDAESFLAILPHPLAPMVLVTHPQGEFAAQGFGTIDCRDFLPRISPVVMALTTRAIYDVLHNPERGNSAFREVEAALDGRWRREGIYVALKERVTDEEWARIFKRFLAAGFLVPPTQDDPLVLPGELSPGEEKALARCLQKPEG
jgi:hypothetical protein